MRSLVRYAGKYHPFLPMGRINAAITKRYGTPSVYKKDVMWLFGGNEKECRCDKLRRFCTYCAWNLKL